MKIVKKKVLTTVASCMLLSSTAYANDNFDYQKDFNDQSLGDVIQKITEMKEMSEFTEAFGVGLTLGFQTVPKHIPVIGKLVDKIPGVNKLPLLGGSMTFEVTHIKDETYAIYCAPGANWSIGSGASVGMSLINIYGCYENNDYTGNFLTVGSGPISHSWGASLDYFLGELERKFHTGGFNPSLLDNEISEYLKLVSTESYYRGTPLHSDRKNRMDETDRFFLNMACDMVKVLGDTNPSFVYPEGCHELESVISVEFDSEKLGQYLGNPAEFAKKFPNAKELSQKFLEKMEDRRYKNQFPNLAAFTKAWTEQLSGCNSWAVGFDPGSLSKSLVKNGLKTLDPRKLKLKDMMMPSMSVTHYAKIREGKILSQDEMKLLQEASRLAREAKGKESLWNRTIDHIGSAAKETYKENVRALNFAKDLVLGCYDSSKWMIKDTYRMTQLFMNGSKYRDDIDIDDVNLDLE